MHREPEGPRDRRGCVRAVALLAGPISLALEGIGPDAAFIGFGVFAWAHILFVLAFGTYSWTYSSGSTTARSVAGSYSRASRNCDSVDRPCPT